MFVAWSCAARTHTSAARRAYLYARATARLPVVLQALPRRANAVANPHPTQPRLQPRPQFQSQSQPEPHPLQHRYSCSSESVMADQTQQLLEHVKVHAHSARSHRHLVRKARTLARYARPLHEREYIWPQPCCNARTKLCIGCMHTCRRMHS